jgi:hypothetical protein
MHLEKSCAFNFIHVEVFLKGDIIVKKKDNERSMQYNFKFDSSSDPELMKAV